MTEEISIFRLIKIIVKHKKVYIWSLLFIPVMTYFSTFLLRNEYISTTTVMFIKGDSNPLLSSFASDIPLIGSMFGGSESAERIIGIAKSRVVMDLYHHPVMVPFNIEHHSVTRKYVSRTKCFLHIIETVPLRRINPLHPNSQRRFCVSMFFPEQPNGFQCQQSHRNDPLI